MSSIPAVKQLLVEVLTAAFADADDPVQVIYGGRESVTVLGDRIITVGGTANGDQQWTNLTRTRRTEKYTLDLVASVSMPGADQQLADDTVLSMWEDAETAINSASYGDGIDVKATGSFRFGEASNGDGRYAAVQFSVMVQATIS